MKMTGKDIKAEWFYENEEGKTKLNWFLYEVALEYHSFIKDAPGLKAFKRSYGAGNIALFCTHYAKQMKKSVLDQLKGKTDAVILDEEYISDFYPRMPRTQVLMLMRVAEQAWESHLSVCGVCPARCLSEKEQRCEMFDNYAKDGLL
jgi:hypothetical protein